MKKLLTIALCAIMLTAMVIVPTQEETKAAPTATCLKLYVQSSEKIIDFEIGIKVNGASSIKYSPYLSASSYQQIYIGGNYCYQFPVNVVTGTVSSSIYGSVNLANYPANAPVPGPTATNAGIKLDATFYFTAYRANTTTITSIAVMDLKDGSGNYLHGGSYNMTGGTKTVSLVRYAGSCNMSTSTGSRCYLYGGKPDAGKGGNSLNYNALANYVVSPTTQTALWQALADTNGDGTIDSGDMARYLQLYG